MSKNHSQSKIYDDEVKCVLRLARDALDGVVAMDDEDADRNGQSEACQEIVRRIDGLLTPKVTN